MSASRNRHTKPVWNTESAHVRRARRGWKGYNVCVQKRNDRDVVRLSVRVTPRASANAVTGYANGVLAIRLTAPPVEGAANSACCAYVADLLSIAKSRVSVAQGAKSRDKVLSITAMSLEELQRVLASLSP